MNLKEVADALRARVAIVDANTKLKDEHRKRVRMVDEWNITLQGYEDRTENAYIKAIYKSYKGMVNRSIVELLTWDELKRFIDAITTQMRSMMVGGWNERR